MSSSLSILSSSSASLLSSSSSSSSCSESSESKYPPVHFVWYNAYHTDAGAYPTPEALDNLEQVKRWMPHSTIKIWYEEDCNRLIETHFPEHKTFFHSLRWWIQRCDFIRYCILYTYGGFYFDFDYTVCKDLTFLYLENDLVLSKELFHNVFILSNFLMMSHPKHPFWLSLIDQCKTNVRKFQEVGMPHYIFPYQWNFFPYCCRVPIKIDPSLDLPKRIGGKMASIYVMLSTGQHALQSTYEKWKKIKNQGREDRIRILEPSENSVLLSQFLFPTLCSRSRTQLGIHWARNDWMRAQAYIRYTVVTFIWIFLFGLVLYFLIL